jgi:hypothetical protein
MKTFSALIPAMLLLACLIEPCTSLEWKFFAISEKTISVDLGPSFGITRGEFDPGENGTISEEFLINNTATPGAAFLALISIYDDVMRRMSTETLSELFLVGGLSEVEANGDVEIGNWTAVDFMGKNVTVHTLKSKDERPSQIGGTYDLAVWNLEGQTYAVLVSVLDRNDTREAIRTLAIGQA